MSIEFARGQRRWGDVMNKINVIAFGGLGGNAFSAGLKTILMRLDGVKGVDFKTYADYKAWRTWGGTLPSWSDPTVLIGHSFGVTAFLAAVRLMGSRGPRIPLAISFDPSPWWWSNLALATSGGNAVPDRIGSIVNWYQRTSLFIRNQQLTRTDGSTNGIENRLITGTIHGAMEDRRDLQDESVRRIRLVVDLLNKK